MSTLQPYKYDDLMRDRRWCDSLVRAGFKVDWRPVQPAETAPTERPAAPTGRPR